MNPATAQSILQLSQAMLTAAREGSWKRVMLLDNARLRTAGAVPDNDDEHWVEQFEPESTVATPPTSTTASSVPADSHEKKASVALQVQRIDAELQALARAQRDVLARLGEKRKAHDQASQGYKATQRLRR